MTTTKELRISDDLRLPADDFAESKGAIIGKSGRGKSGGVKVVIEECYRAQVPFVEFDPSGVAWGARSSFDGSKPSGMQILIIGGRHGDVKLERGAGADVAKEVVRANISCVIDFQGEPKSVYRQFAKDFCETLLEINDSPRVVILEEAHELVPQLVRPDQTQTFDAVSRLVGQGRNMGIGVVLVSQRTMKINKDVLSQCDWVLVFGLSGPHDKKAMKEWVHDKDIEEDVWEEFEVGLSKLAKQHAWFWSPEAFGGAFKVVKIRNFTTFHPDRTHLRKLGLLDRKPVTTDIAGIKAKLGTVMAKLADEKTAVVDAKRLQHQVKQLEAQLAKERARPPPASSGPKVEIKRVEIPVVKDQQVRRVEVLIAKAGAAVMDLQNLTAKIQTAAVELHRELVRVGGAGTHSKAGASSQIKSPPAFKTPSAAPPTRHASAPTAQAADGEVSLRSGERRMLQTLAQRHQLKMTRAQLGTLAGFTPSGGTFSTYYGTLKRHGFLEENGNGEVRVSQAGVEFLGGDIPPAPSTTRELQDMWKRMVRAGEAKMLDELVAVYPDGLTREQLGERTEFTASGGTFSTYLGTLKRNGLVEVDGDHVKASATLFIDGA